MKEKKVSTKIQVYAYNELNNEDKNLVDLAKEATKASYAPYSKFNVGAALLLENGVIIKGANQENAAFPAGICAERSACFNAGANYPGVAIVKIAITAAQDGEIVTDPCAPCGVCRQSLLEFETHAGKPMEVLLVGRDAIYHLESVKSLLPLSFTEF
ncbi:MAG: cytidine deaminase [Muribaculaceae bacterium]|nr:cytidine deaminase [Muribaculaceae bacterium]